MSENQKKQPNKFLTTLFIVAGVLLAISVVLILLAVLTKSSVFNFILFICGIIEITVGIIFFKIAKRRIRYTCPDCGTQRKHHRAYISTTKRDSNNTEAFTSKYTHHYLDTYVCPACGCKMDEKVKKSGGTYVVYKDNRVDDRRIEPEEF